MTTRIDVWPNHDVVVAIIEDGKVVERHTIPQDVNATYPRIFYVWQNHSLVISERTEDDSELQMSDVQG